MNPLFFATQSEFRNWLKKNHIKEKELWVGYHKKDTGKPSIDWPQSVEEALCFGWIDGIRKSIDPLSYMIRFTPRKPKSIWSNKNINTVEKLINDGRMYPAGIEAFNKLDDKKSRIYSFEQGVVALSNEYEKIFMKNKKAWAFFQSSVPSYRKPAIHWVMSAKQEETRLKRLRILINDSAEDRKIGPLRRNNN